eukprot:986326-Alexandrium_andersonii.AAC.1
MCIRDSRKKTRSSSVAASGAPVSGASAEQSFSRPRPAKVFKTPRRPRNAPGASDSAPAPKPTRCSCESQ